MEKEGHQGLFSEVHKMEWVYLMNQLLQYIAISLQLLGTSALLSFANQDATLWTGPDKKLHADHLQMLSHFEDFNGTFTNTCYKYNPLNSITSLTHWKVLSNLVSQLPQIQQEVIKTINTICFQTCESISEEGEEDEVIGSDSHSHPNQLVKKAWKSIAEVMEEGKVRLDPIVSCLAFPHTWYWMQWNEVSDATRNTTIGWHPTQAHIYSIQHFDTFVSVVAEESTIGIGKIGLDYFCIDNKLHQQKQQDLLRKLVDFTNTSELLVIIHCHVSEVPGDEDAAQNCIQILASHLEKCYPVYVHCFNGSIQKHHMWMSHFPNAHFGISPLVLDSSCRHPKLMGIIRKIDVVWLLLESDALYFRDPDSHQLGTSHLVCQIN